MLSNVTERLSVVITTHNRELELARAINSVINQSVLPFEIIIIDDGSRLEVSPRNYSVPDSVELRVIRNSVPKGANYSRNLGLNSTNAELVSFLDDDDEFCPSKVEFVLAEYERSRADIISSFAEVRFNSSSRSYSIKPPKKVAFKDQLLRNLVGTTSMITVNRSFFMKIGGFNETLPARQDYEAWLRCLKNGAVFSCVNKVLTFIHVEFSSKSISKSLSNNFKAMNLISEIYAQDLKILSNSEVRTRDIATRQFYCHKYFLSGNRFRGAFFSMKSFFVTRSPRFAVLGISFILGRWAIIALLTLKKR